MHHFSCAYPFFTENKWPSVFLSELLIIGFCFKRLILRVPKMFPLSHSVIFELPAVQKTHPPRLSREWGYNHDHYMHWSIPREVASEHRPVI
jgi:hypothetical protein